MGIPGVQALSRRRLEAHTRAAESVGLPVGDARETLRVGGDEVEAELAVLDRGDDEVVGDIAAEHTVLLAGQAHAVTRGRRRGLRLRERVALPGFEGGDGEEGLALAHAGQDRLLLLLAAGEQERVGAEDGGCDEGLEHERAAERLEDDGHLGEGHLRAAVGLGHGEAGQAHLRELLPLLTRDALVAGEDRLAGGRIVFGAQVLAEGAGELLLDVVEFKIHGCPLPSSGSEPEQSLRDDSALHL
ncbi:Uncharacterised protein [Brevibacterium casei]|uniref:Uncharacterized protein n=1 Tax=Brevibacterium casei TaxID=33889 RepID=A0A449D6X3_9MICO|nr:Uncharacterised protein [Brevibacterium casei]